MKYGLYGCGIKGEEFVWKNQDIFDNIDFCIDGRREGLFHGRRISKINEIDEGALLSHHIIVAASPLVYNEIKQILEDRGCQEFRDFEWAYGFRRKKVIINANCYGEFVAAFLKRSPTYMNEYFNYPIPRVYENPKGEIGDNLIKNVDIFLHQDIRNDSGLGYKLSDEYVLSKLKKGAVAITFPNCVDMGHWLFPQLETEERAFHHKCKGYSYYKDNVLEEAILKYDTVEDIKKFYINYEYANSYLDDLYAKDMEKLIRREKNWDIKISDYIEKNKQDVKMFRDIRHLSNAAFQEIAVRIADILNMEIWKLGDLGGDSIVPIIPCVKRYYNMDFSSREKQRDMWSVEYMDDIYEEYVRQYSWFWHDKVWDEGSRG